MKVTYILCLYKKDRLRGDFGFLQSGPKGVISEIGVYVYILSMGKGGVRVENTPHFFCAARAPYMDSGWYGSSPRSIRDRIAIAPIPTQRTVLWTALCLVFRCLINRSSTQHHHTPCFSLMHLHTS